MLHIIQKNIEGQNINTPGCHIPLCFKLPQPLTEGLSPGLPPALLVAK